MIDIVMPRLSDSMEEGTVLRWLKSPGDEVSRGDELVEIETDKANMVYDADTSGTLVEILAEEGETLPIGEVIARIGSPDETPSGDRPAQPAGGPVERVESAPGPAERTVGGAAPRGGGVKASPVARRLAAELGVDIASLSGSGPAGRVTKGDVEAAAADSPDRTAGAKGEVTTVELSKLQRSVVRRMSESKATAPHFYLESEVDMSSAVETRSRLENSGSEAAPTLNDLVVKAAAVALTQHPRVNGAYRDGRVEQYSRVNVGVAVAAGDALVVPTVFDADRKGLRRIASETRALAERVRDGRITPPELSGGTFTVSNLGMFGITAFQGVINPPQAAILTVGSVREVPGFDESGGIGARRLMRIGLACDHRVLYGADGARFLDRVRELLEEPGTLPL